MFSELLPFYPVESLKLFYTSAVPMKIKSKVFFQKDLQGTDFIYKISFGVCPITNGFLRYIHWKEGNYSVTSS